MTDLARLKSEIVTTARRLRDLRRELREAKGAPPPKTRVRIRQRPKGGTWKADRDECDLLMARIVKVERDHCEACPETRRMTFQWAHGFSRSYRGARWDFENSFCLCAACHKRFTHDPLGWKAWMVERQGQQCYDDLERRARILTRFDPRILLGLRGRAAELGVLTTEGWREWQEARP